MGTTDGNVQGITKILDNGPDGSRMNIVLVAEGFKDTEQQTFNNYCNDFVAALQAESWYSILGNAINVHKLNVASLDSGTDEPATCPDGSTGAGTLKRTYFDSKFCNSGIWRCLSGDTILVREELDAYLPQWTVGIVLVNTVDHGGCASGNVSFTCVRPGWVNTALHEMGHNFGLADEYQYWAGCTSGETGQNNAPTWEPGQFNVTAETSRSNLKWRHLLTPGVPVPTMENPNCSQCDLRPNVLSDDNAIGLFEGAAYYHCGYFRPAYRCRMRNSGDSFCRVCVEAIAKRLEEFIASTPVMEVEPTLLDFGDVGQGLTLYLAFEVRNLRVGRPGAIEVTLSAPTGEFSYAPGTETVFTLSAPIFETFTSKLVFVAFKAPESGGPLFTGQLTVSRSDDISSPSVTVNLNARSVPPIPVDSVLIMDRSGSMIEDTGIPGTSKMSMAIEAAKLYVDLVKDNDKIGVVRYNQISGPGDVLLPLTVAGDGSPGDGRSSARSVLNTSNLSPNGTTSIGAGIINGSSVLDAATVGGRALIVLTDGWQNTLPDIPDGTAVVLTKTPKQRVFAVGLGLNQLENKLQEIASVTNGMAQITGDLVEDREFLLQKLYVQILSDVSDEAFVRDPRCMAKSLERQSTTIYIGETDVAADFIVVYRRRGTELSPKQITFELESPDGELFSPVVMDALPNAEFLQQPGHICFRWRFPISPDKPLRHAGAWKVWVFNRSKYDMVYSVMAKARSDFRLGGRVAQKSYSPGEPMEIILEPTLYGLPIKLDSPVKVKVTRPDGLVRAFSLSRDEFGAYRHTFQDTALVGPYHISSEVSATTPLGHRITRFRQMTGLIYLPIQYDGGDKTCQEAKAALERLRRIINRCCTKRKEEVNQDILSLMETKILIEEVQKRLDKEKD